MATIKENDSSAEELVKKEKCELTNDSDSAKIISNELLLVGVYSGAEKIDELTSLEREIAKMHHVGPSTNLEYLEADNYNTDSNVLNNEGLSGNRVSESKSKYNSINLLGGIDNTDNITFLKCDPENETDVIKEEAGSTALEHEDLIAVLKGFDDHSSTIKGEKDGTNVQQHMRPPSVTESELAEGVTIEGEGQFQIMDVVYDELDENESVPMEESPEDKISPPTTSKPVSNTSSSSKSHLTNEEIRAMAMEQMAGLTAMGDRQRKRKQDIKPIKVDDSSDLVTTLGADWSEDDIELDIKATSSVNNSPKSNINEVKKNLRETQTDANSQVLNGKELTSKSNDLLPKAIKEEKSEPDAAAKAVGEDAIIVNETVNKDNSTPKPVVGFKRTRIIKRKLIWDPDAPETQISFAQFARNSSKKNMAEKNQINKSQSQKSSGVSILKSVRGEITKTQNKNQNEQPIRGSDSKTAPTLNASKTKGTISPSPTNVQSKDEIECKVQANLSVKRRSETPVINGSKKKRVSEIDRLVSDEGAANMLHSLESERSKLIAEQGADKPHKPLMRSRAATISERIIKRETTPTSGKVSTTTTTSGEVKNKRTPKQKPSSTWDYVYKQKASEDAMIIRRRSNSSYSSNASIRRLSIDAPISKSSNAQHNQTSSTSVSNVPRASGAKTTQRSLLKSSNENNGSAKETSASLSSKSGGVSNSFEFIKPEMKTNQKGNRRVKGSTQVENVTSNDIKKSTAVSGSRRGSRSPSVVDEKDKGKNTGLTNKVSLKPSKEEPSTGSNISDVIVKKIAKVGQIVFNTQKAKINYTFTAQMLNKLVDILDKLGKDVECNAVLITTNSPNFCSGIDFTDLTCGSMEKRKQSAVHLATAVKNYLKTLATFPKPLIAGVNGSNSGLGVMQLPLFDIVIGSDKGSYETPYVKMGQIPEGYCIWNNTTKIRDNYKTKLLWLGEKIHSTESALSGLVHKLTASGKVNEDALQTAKKMAMMSTESYRFMKKAIINNNLETINKLLDEEFDTIIEQWTSAECYDNFRKYLESGHH